MKHAGRNCRDLVTAISDYIDGDLTAARCRDLESHLHACPCCERFADSLKRAVALCQAAGETRLPVAVQRRARARITKLLTALPAERGPAGRSGTAKPAGRRPSSSRRPARTPASKRTRRTPAARGRH